MDEPKRAQDNALGATGPHNSRMNLTPGEAVAFVRRHGVVLQAARGPVPSLAEAIAGGPIRGSWWGHPKGHDIFRAAEAVGDSDEVLVCKLVEGRVTYVHRRMWPALVKLAAHFRKDQLAKVWNEHTRTGAHRARRKAFPSWVPSEVMREAAALSVSEAEGILASLLPFARKRNVSVRRTKGESSRPSARPEKKRMRDC